MCTREEQEGMVNAIKRAGWVRSTFVWIGLLFALVASVWTAHGHISGQAEFAARGIVNEHKIEDHGEIDVRLERILTILEYRYGEQVDTENSPEGQ